MLHARHRIVFVYFSVLSFLFSSITTTKWEQSDHSDLCVKHVLIGYVLMWFTCTQNCKYIGSKIILTLQNLS